MYTMHLLFRLPNWSKLCHLPILESQFICRKNIYPFREGFKRNKYKDVITPSTTCDAESETRCSWPLLLVNKQAVGTCVASGPDSDLQAFSHNPAHSSIAPLAFDSVAIVIQPSTRGTVDSHNWSSRLVEKPVARSYRALDYD
ncbi:hypothetical protein L6452_14155 [Arctium lappa]|uniref:Uncharacterized protein n=1 Tax=Arctium lappa TaxID=4217 RepID=A0ACB9CK75_ARCLA|nr:hypothetical protein L6452_14155 [Arctium lappa]